MSKIENSWRCDYCHTLVVEQLRLAEHDLCVPCAYREWAWGKLRAAWDELDRLKLDENTNPEVLREAWRRTKYFEALVCTHIKFE